MEERRINQESELHAYLTKLIHAEKKRELEGCRQKQEDKSDDGRIQHSLNEIHTKHDKYLSDMEELFCQVDEKRKVSVDEWKRNDSLTCKHHPKATKGIQSVDVEKHNLLSTLARKVNTS